MTPALFRVLTWPQLRRHPGRSLLIVAGVMLAVGMYASMHLANGAIEDAFLEATDRLAGSAQLQIHGGQAGIPEDVLDRVRAEPCVEAATALMMRTAGGGQGGVAILGIDLLDDSRFREYRLEHRARGLGDALVLLAQPDSTLVTAEFAHRYGLRRGEAFPVWTGREATHLKVRGFLENTGAVQAYGGSVAVMDLYAAQQTFGRRGYFDRVDVAVSSGQNVGECRDTLQQALGPHIDVDPPPSRGSSADAFSKSYRFVVESSALLGILVAMFLIHQAGTTSVAQREREIGILLGLGADEHGIFRTILLESALLGVLGAVGGIAAGWVAAGPLSALLSKLLVSAFGAAIVPAPAGIDWKWAAATVAAAAVACILAGLGPAANAVSIPPVQLMRARRYSALPASGGVRSGSAAIVCAGGAVIGQVVNPRPETLYFTLPLAALALGLAGSTLSSLAYRAVRPLFKAVWPLEGALAVDSLLRANRRTRGMLLGLALTIATFIAISGLTSAYALSFHRWSRQLVNADLLIHSSVNPSEFGRTFPAATGERLSRVPGVKAVLPARRLRASAEGRPVIVFAMDFALWKKYGGLPLSADPGSAVVSRNFANQAGLRSGGPIRLASPDGAFVLPVGDVIDDYLSEQGNVWLDWSVFERRYHDNSAELFAVYLEPGIAPGAMRAALLREFDPHAPVMILDGAAFHAHLDRIVARWRAISYLQVLAALATALLGAGSFLVVSIAERRRELGLLALVGATPGQLSRCVVVEALAISAAAVLLGCLLGLLLQAYLLFTLRQSINGYDLPWQFDTGPLLALLIALPLGALAAAALPWLSLSRMDLAREVECDA